MQELILIGAIALIVFGPRKLPQLMRMGGKMMAEFRKATSDFKETWEKEVDFEDFKETNQIKTIPAQENSIHKVNEAKTVSIASPEIKEIRQEDLEKMFPAVESESTTAEQSMQGANGKRDWL